MAEKSRGVVLTIFALLFAVLAISDFLKPFHLDPSAAFVFLGTKLTGTANAIMGPLFGIFLLVYAYGIWAMRKYALQVAYIFFALGAAQHGSVHYEEQRYAAARCQPRRRHSRDWLSARSGDRPPSPQR